MWIIKQTSHPEWKREKKSQAFAERMKEAENVKKPD